MSLIQHLAGSGLIRHWVDGAFQHYARRRVRQLDRLDLAGCQQATLLRLVRHAANTRFGRDHGFASIRSIRDYQRQVPLRGYELFWKEYWQPAFPHLQGVSWPDRIPYFALSSGTTSGNTKYLPISGQMLASNRKAALTTLALFRVAHPEAALFTGRMFFLGGSSDLPELQPDSGIRAGDLSGIAAVELSPLLRPYTYPPLKTALLADWDQKVQRLAEESARLPITLLSGVPSWLLLLFERLKRVTGKATIAEVWPTLRLVIHGGTKFDPYRELFRREIGSDLVHCLETYPCSEGFVAAEDPRHGLLRLLPDHGLFFEFVPVAELGHRTPTRHTVAELAVGVQYAVVLTSCAGLWSYLLGDTVCFESLAPPLLRFTGRTRYYLSAFGEHLISEEVEQAVTEAAQRTHAAVVDFHVGPIFPDRPSMAGRHRWLIEFAAAPADLAAFAAELDAALRERNADYAAHRQGDLTLAPPEICVIRRGGFADWLRSRGQLGGQHKVPRMDNTGQLTQELSRWAETTTESSREQWASLQGSKW